MDKEYILMITKAVDIQIKRPEFSKLEGEWFYNENVNKIFLFPNDFKKDIGSGIGFYTLSTYKLTWLPSTKCLLKLIEGSIELYKSKSNFHIPYKWRGKCFDNNINCQRKTFCDEDLKKVLIRMVMYQKNKVWSNEEWLKIDNRS